MAEVLDPGKWPREQLALARERARWVLSGHQVKETQIVGWMGSAVVHGRDGIRRFCANRLPWLTSPHS